MLGCRKEDIVIYFWITTLSDNNEIMICFFFYNFCLFIIVGHGWPSGWKSEGDVMPALVCKDLFGRDMDIDSILVR